MKEINVPEKYQFLDGAALKWIAMLSMLIDHVNKGIILNLMIAKDMYHPVLVFVNNVFEILGRIAFPIFLFLLVEGFRHTRSRAKYFGALMVFGVLAEVPYDMFESGAFFDWGGQNMYFTLALGLLTLCLVEKLIEKLGKAGVVFGILVTLASGFLASYLALDYHFYGIIIPVIFYLAGERRIPGSILSYLVVIKEIWSVLGFITLNFYNGKRGRINKWFCYAFYPAHLFLIGLIRMYVLKF